MSWRVVSVENPAHLSLSQGSLVIKNDETIKLPIEDIDTVIIDNYAVTMSANLLGELSTNNVATILCDRQHVPCAIITPLSQHSRQAKITNRQINISQPLRKNLWQAIVKQKIINQAQVLSRNGSADIAGQLIKLATEVRSGDVTNRESIAARLYFAELLEDATRRNPTWYNSALNYCYAIVRSLVARSIAARGLVPALGLFHHNELNGFNLADDLIEPYRAFVDYFVMFELSQKGAKIHDRPAQLNKEERHFTIDIINKYVSIKDKQFTIKDAVDITVESLVKSIIKSSADELLLPIFK